ncbi:MAG: glycosyltransferase [Sedimentisphaerales bacterium]|nr:glycosyltransferase [Sedimentisphaerales bacterium]
MKLLILSNNPDRASFRQRFGIYIDYLRTEGIETEVHKLPKDYPARWELFRQSAHYDGVLLHKKTLNFFDARILRKHAKKIIYDFDDAIMFSPHHPDKKYTSHFRLFKRTAKLADCVITGNEYLAEYAKRFNRCVWTLPTGVVLDSYKINVEKPDDGKIRLVWIGSKATLKYLAGLIPVLEETGKKYDNVVLRIIADDFIDLENMPVEKHRWSAQTEARDLKACDIGLAPLPDNLFTRGKCGFKILQYFAASLPVVASAVGINKKFVNDSHAGQLADNTEQWIEAITELVGDEQKRIEVGRKSRDYIKDFDCHILAEKLAEFLMLFFAVTKNE